MNVAGGATDLAADPFVVPGIHITESDGNALKAWVAQRSGHQATITPSGDSPVLDPAAADHLADFSSRGPYTDFDFIAPSISAPGVDVFAAGADLSIENPDASVAGAYGAISGTSMASPHATGSATLLKQVHPDWTPAEILSAMATTGKTSMVKEDGHAGGSLRLRRRAHPARAGGERRPPPRRARRELQCRQSRRRRRSSHAERALFRG